MCDIYIQCDECDKTILESESWNYMCKLCSYKDQGIESKPYHFTLSDELGESFGVSIRAFDDDHAIESIRFSYPESGILHMTTLPLFDRP